MADPVVIEAICDRLAEGESMRGICSDEGMPNRRTLERWMADDAALAASIARAREVGFEQRAEKAIETAQAAEDAAKGRLAFDAERWFLSKLYPKRFGDKQLIGSDPENPLPAGAAISITATPAEAAASYQKMITGK